MGKQLLFCVEADNKSRTDWVYIKSTIDAFFKVDNSISIKPIFMGGKGNYRRQKVTGQIKKKINEYKRNGKTFVIYCVDTDDLNKDPNRLREMKEIREYCEQKGYEFVWFCRDIEEVFWGTRVDDNEKYQYADRFRRQNVIEEIEVDMLQSSEYNVKNSNIISVLEEYLEKK